MSEHRRRHVGRSIGRASFVTTAAVATVALTLNTAVAAPPPTPRLNAHWQKAPTDRLATGHSTQAAKPVVRELQSAPVQLLDRTPVTGGRGLVAVSKAGAFVAVGSLRVQARPAGPGNLASALDVTVASPDATARVGVDGAIVQLSTPGGDAADTDVVLDYSALVNRYSPDFINRLQVIELADCPQLANASASQCATRRPLAASNDLRSHTLRLRVKMAGRAVHTEAKSAVPLAGASVKHRASAGQAPIATQTQNTATTLAVTAGSGGPTGNYSATSLARSATWSAGDSSGAFSWNYPLATPPTQNGPTPQLSLSYTSSAVDGHTASTNNQPSWIGEGFDLTANYIERRYQSCADNDTTYKSGDECWAGDNASIVLNGKSNELIYNSTTKLWHLKDDDGTKVEKLTGASNGDSGTAGVDGVGEYWRVTDVSGTQYIFGINRLPGWISGNAVTNSVWTVPVFGNNAGEPCHASTFDAGYCTQAWRWNLDRVVDPDGNSMAYYYAKQQNAYGRNLTSTKKSLYDMGGYLTRIDYGMRSGSEYSTSTPATQQVLFTVADRCVVSGSTCTSDKANWSNWPDVPWDQYCSTSTSVTSCSDLAPTFFTTKRLSSLTTRVLKSVSNGVATYQNVDAYTLIQTFPNPNYGTAPKSNAALWLSRIRHTGNNGTAITLPDVVFSGTPMANRVNRVNDGLPPMNSFRINAITSEAGDTLSVTYSGAGQVDDPGVSQECNENNIDSITPSNNYMRCFPAWYDPYSTTKPDWFHKYLVLQVVDDPKTPNGEPVVNTYQYRGNPAWALDDDDMTPVKKRLYNHWRGYGTVRTIQGSTAEDPDDPRGVFDTVFYRGLGADLTDSQGGVHADPEELQGRTLESITYSGMAADGTLGRALTSNITSFYISAATATRNSYNAKIVRPRTLVSRTWLPDTATWRVARTTTTYNSYGLVTQVNDEGDLSDANDDQCTTTTYTAPNTTAWIVDAVQRTETLAAGCGQTPTFPDDAVSDTRYYYDGGALGAAPTKGHATTTESLHDYSGGTPHYVTTARTVFDANGRITQTTDVLNRVTKTAYTPATNGPVTSTTATDAMGFVTTNVVDPATGKPTKTTDPNGKVTELTYDALGRLTQVWMPNWLRSSHASTPSYRYSYVYGTSSTDTTLANAANYTTTSELKQDGASYNTTYNLLDGMLRPRQTQAVAPGTTRLIKDTFYNSRGLVVKTYDGYAASGSPSGVVYTTTDNQVDAQTWTTYDGEGRPTAVIDAPLGQEKSRTSTIYGGSHIDTIPPNGGSATVNFSDARGRTTESRVFAGSTPSGSYDKTTYTYTPAGKLASVVDAGGSTWSYKYDVRGFQTDAYDPDKGHTQTTYDNAGRAIQTTDARGVVKVTAYDNADRPTSVRKDSTTGAILLSWTYDTLAKGQLTSSSSFNGADEYKTAIVGYNNLYQPTGQTVTVPAAEGPLAGTYTTNFYYLMNGLITSISLPAVGSWARESVGFDYNTQNQIVDESSSAIGTIVSSATYTAFGEPQTIHADRGNSQAVDEVFTYAPGTRQVLNKRVTQPYTSAVISDTTYGYDSTGDLVSQSDAATGDNQCFAYDGVRRLTEAWTPGNGDCTATRSSTALGGPAPYWKSWTYQSNSSRKTQTTHGVGASPDVTDTYVYGPATGAQPHGVSQVTTTGGASAATGAYGWDPAGNLLSRPGHSYAWDPFGHLQSDTMPSGVTSYLYDAGGNRLVRHDKDGTTLYLGNTEVRYAAGAATPTRYYDFGGDTVAVRTGPSSLSWTLTDQHNTQTIAINADDTAQIQRRYEDPFGNDRGATTAFPGDHAFVGGVADAEGTVHLGAREYLPSTGQFLSVDPVINYADPGQLHPYTYAHNDPVNGSDPDGRMFAADFGPDGGHYYGADKPSGGSSSSTSVTSSTTTDTSTNTVTVTTTVATTTSAGTTYSTSQQVYSYQPPPPPKPKHWWQKALHWIGDVTGINDVINCVSNPSVGGCVMAVVDVATTFVPAAKGAVMGIKAARAGLEVARGIEEVSAVSKTVHAAEEACKVNSFDPATKVVLATGVARPIAALVVGDVVKASDPVTGQTKAEPITDTIRGIGNKNLVDVTVTDASGKSSTIVATDEHPFWVASSGTWTAAKDLAPGDRLVSAGSDGALHTSVTVTATHGHVRLQQVYNLTVAELHTYYVQSPSGDEVLVHNCGVANDVPTVTFSRSRAPGIAENFDDAVANGAPTRLTRVGDATRKANRRAALRGQSRAPAGQSLDEYPFACSAQGGCGSFVRSVPVGEQNYQGGVLSRFFQDSGVQPGDPFDIVFGP